MSAPIGEMVPWEWIVNRDKLISAYMVEIEELEARCAAAEEALRAADRLRERVRQEDKRAHDFGRWQEAADYDDARAKVAVPEENQP